MANSDQIEASDTAKTIIAWIMMPLGCLTFIGIIPIIVVILGYQSAKRTGNPHTITTTSRWAKGMVAAVGLPTSIAVFSSNQYMDNGSAAATIFIITMTFLMVFHFLWEGPMSRIIAARSQGSSDATRSDIIRRDSLSTYSVADELRKWRSLLDDGTVTEDEFKAARTKIMG